MTAEERLRSIIDAADASDRDDVQTRTLLVTALKESGIDFTEEPRGPIGTGWRAALRLSPFFWCRERRHRPTLR